MARALGFPDVVVQGMLSVCFVAELMPHAFGVGWFLARQARRPPRERRVAGEVLAPGRCAKRLPEGGRRRAALDVWCTKDDGTPTIVGTASALR